MGSAAGAREESEGGLGKRFAPVFFEKFCLRQTVFFREKFSGNIAGPCAAGGFRAAMRVQGRWRRGVGLPKRSLSKRREPVGEYGSTPEGEPCVEHTDVRAV